VLAAAPAAALALCGTGTSTGAGQSFPSAVTLTCNTTLNDIAGGPISFASTVDGGFNLHTATTGTTTFTGAVGASVPLGTLDITTGNLNVGSTIKVSALSLTSTSGVITQSAPFDAGNLSGSSPSDVVLPDPGNHFIQLDGFSAKNLTLSAVQHIDGPVSVSESLAISSKGYLFVVSEVTGSSVNLTGTGILLSGFAKIAGDTALSLDATTGGPISLFQDTTVTSSGTLALTAATTSVDGALNFVSSGGAGVVGTVTGNYSQTGDLTLNAFATSMNELAVSGNATLGGTLTINFVSVPSVGQNLTVLTAASVIGTFATVNVTGLPSDRIAKFTYSASSMALTIRSAVTCFVKFDAHGAHNGSSWDDAYPNVQSALSNPGCDQIWVARGVYKPTTTADRSIAFHLDEHVLGLYGGFAGNETQLAERDVAGNLTVLSGDIDNNDTGTNGVDADTSKIVGNNSYHVVVIDGPTAAAPVGNATALDGFTITGGKADDVLSAGGGVHCNSSAGPCGPRLSNLVFRGNLAAGSGGALYNDGTNGSSPLITNSTFSGNSAVNGGAVYNGGGGGISSPTITNSTFSGNSAAKGGAIYDDGSGGISSPSITNSTFSGNSASSCGGAIYDDATDSGKSSPAIQAVTFFGNSANSVNGDGSAICDFTATGINATTLTDAIVWGNTLPEISTFSGGMTLASPVILQENACPAGVTCTGALNGNDPHLGPLQDNGGPTLTHMLGDGSSAISGYGNGPCGNAPINGLDQRGFMRTFGGLTDQCDIGPVEATRLTLNVTDGVAYGLYGKELQYIVTLQNLGGPVTVHVSGFGSAALDGPNTLWFCATAGSCTTTQTQGSLSDVATMAPSATLTWLVNVPVIAGSPAPTGTMTIRSDAAAAVSDKDTLAIFRGTFDGP